MTKIKSSEDNIKGNNINVAEQSAPVEKKVTPKKAEATAKAGKRSAKALKENENKLAKEARKQEAKSTEPEKNTPKARPKTRSLLERRGKKYRESSKIIDSNKQYSLEDAIKLIPSTSKVKFDASVELHIRLNVDPRQADQNIRQTVLLPHGSGKNIRIAVFCEADQQSSAKKAGADIVGADEFLQQLDKSEINFDVLIATPTLMAKLGKYAKLLGPKGLMPNPKSGTVTKNVSSAVSEAKSGKIEYRVDSGGIVHVGIGKVSFDSSKLLKNADAILSSVRSAKPASVKGTYFMSAYLTTSMGPSIKIEV